MNNKNRKVVFSGAQPTGSLTLGNYIGALQNWKLLEKEHNCLYCIVDSHSLTVRQDPKKFNQTSISFLVQYLASGLDPEKNIIFFQSHVPQHAELSWILGCNTYIGELNRMTQFKDKSEKNKDNINSGLFTYPVLMAADILLYKANLVPVGEDQNQHLELTRDIATRFNNLYGETFPIPEIYTPKIGARIMSLQEPTKKMSKSDENMNGTIFLMDSEDIIMKKMKRAVTDSENVIAYRDEQAGIKNLINIYSSLSGLSIEEILEKYEGKGYGDFKADTGEVVIEFLRPFRKSYEEYMNNLDYVEKIYKTGAKRAYELAEDTMTLVRERMGLVHK